VAALPYDVMNTEEARHMAQGNPHSFLRVDRAEIDLTADINPYDDQVYEQARRALTEMKRSGVLQQDETARLYVYRLGMQSHVQTGLVACAAVDDYQTGLIRKHELTRWDKEQDRIRHVDACGAHTGPIFMLYRRDPEIRRLLQTAVQAPPIFDFTAEDGISHTGWAVDEDLTSQLVAQFKAVESLYIADGHHRAASAAKVAETRRRTDPHAAGEYDYFLSVLFSDDEVCILPYYRAVRDLNALTEEAFLARVGDVFQVTELPAGTACAPGKAHEFGLFMGQRWYRLELRPEHIPQEALAALDVSILQDKLLRPILGIGDPRADRRLDFIGGNRGLKELERRASQDMAASFSLRPTQVEELIAVTDAGGIMPPKSTWFEPKLRSGLFIHDL
jgi:uncharacterized protein (DUF1015 family)